MKNISEDEIACPCMKYKNKKSHHKDIVIIYLFKNNVKKYLI